MAAILVVATGALVSVGCEDEPDLPVGPPRCEPARELEVERRLKEGFRALFEGDAARAKQSFEAVEKDDPNHPESQLGLRLASRLERGRGGGLLPSQLGVEAESIGQPGTERALVVAGERVPVEVAVNVERYRFEELSALARLRSGADATRAARFGERTRSGLAVPSGDRAAVSSAVDLVVLHDTRTQTARAAIVELEAAGATTHFIIDWDGAIYQTLDLGLMAEHTGDASTDARAVGVHLVNPVELDQSPELPARLPHELPRMVLEARDGLARRSESEAVLLNGVEARHWSYTSAQLESLGRLVRALGRVLPQVPAAVPRDTAGRVPTRVFDGAASFSGVLGHLHLSAGALDPGAGFPWEDFAGGLSRAD